MFKKLSAASALVGAAVMLGGVDEARAERNAAGPGTGQCDTCGDEPSTPSKANANPDSIPQCRLSYSGFKNDDEFGANLLIPGVGWAGLTVELNKAVSYNTYSSNIPGPQANQLAGSEIAKFQQCFNVTVGALNDRFVRTKDNACVTRVHGDIDGQRLDYINADCQATSVGFPVKGTVRMEPIVAPF